MEEDEAARRAAAGAERERARTYAGAKRERSAARRKRAREERAVVIDRELEKVELSPMTASLPMTCQLPSEDNDPWVDHTGVCPSGSRKMKLKEARLCLQSYY